MDCRLLLARPTQAYDKGSGRIFAYRGKPGRRLSSDASANSSPIGSCRARGKAQGCDRASELAPEPQSESLPERSQHVAPPEVVRACVRALQVYVWSMCYATDLPRRIATSLSLLRSIRETAHRWTTNEWALRCPGTVFLGLHFVRLFAWQRL